MLQTRCVDHHLSIFLQRDICDLLPGQHLVPSDDSLAVKAERSEVQGVPGPVIGKLERQMEPRELIFKRFAQPCKRPASAAKGQGVPVVAADGIKVRMEEQTCGGAPDRVPDSPDLFPAHHLEASSGLFEDEAALTGIERAHFIGGVHEDERSHEQDIEYEQYYREECIDEKQR